MAKYVEVLDGEVNTISLDTIRSCAKWMLEGKDGMKLGTLYAVNGEWLVEVNYDLVSSAHLDITNELVLTYSICSGIHEYDQFTVYLDPRYIPQ